MEKKLVRELHLSPNELEAAVRAEKDKWKVFRIQQVREQAKEEAKRIREAIQKEELQMLQDLRQKLVLNCDAEKENQMQHLRQEYIECLQALGEAHEQAKRQPDACKVLLQRAKHNKQKAERRGLEARRVHREQQLQQNHEKNKVFKQRQDTLQWEKLRASRVASLPTPEAFKKKRSVVEKKVPTVQFHEAGTFTTTSYVPKNVIIEKEVKSTKLTAKEAAVVEEMALAAREEICRKEAEEQERKKEQRGRQALAREHLNRKYHNLISQLDQAQHDHQLSAYLQGSDHSIYETEDSRLKHQASLQQHVEKAVEKVLKEIPLPTDDDSKEHTQLSSASSDFIENDETSRDESGWQTFSPKVQDLKTLLEKISKQRHRLLQGIYECIPEEEEKVEEVFDKSKRVVDENDMTQIKKDEISPEVHQLSTELALHDVEGTLLGEKYVHQDSYRGSRPVHEDIHMAETVPFHLFQGYDKRSTVAFQKNGSQPTYAESSNQESVSEETEIRINGNAMGTETSTDEYAKPTSPIIHNLLAGKQSMEYSNSGISTTSYMSPPLSIPTRKVLTGETYNSLKKVSNWRKCVNSKSISKEGGDIHVAETAPSHLLPGYYDDESTNSSHTSASQPSSAKNSFQESSSDDIEVKVHISGGENLGSVSPIADQVEYLTSQTSSTEYLSPPSTIPTTGILASEVYDNLKKIQQQRQTVQHLLDSISDKRNQQLTHMKSTSPNIYTEKLKGEGSGKRPQRKKDKFEIQKKEILQYYLKKLLKMKGDELQNLSGSSVEGSGLTVSSICTLMESVQKEKDDTLTVSSSESYDVPSPKEVSRSNPTYSYRDIDEFPVKLGCHSSSKNKNSSKDKLLATHISDTSEGYSINCAIPSLHYSQGSGTRHKLLQYFQSPATAVSYDIIRSSPGTMVSTCSQSDVTEVSSTGTVLSSYSHSDESSLSSSPNQETPKLQRQLEILVDLRKLQKLKQDLMMEKDNVLQEKSSGKMPDISSSFPRSGPEVTTTFPASSSSLKSARKVSFGGTHPRAGLSTIYEFSSDLSESHLNISGSTSYQTPSREYESSLDDTGSQVSVSQRYDTGAPHIPLMASTWSETDMGNKDVTEDADRKIVTHLHTPSEFSYPEFSPSESTQKLDKNYLGSDISEFTPLLGELTQHSGLQLSCDNEQFIHSSSSTVSFLKPEEVENSKKIQGLLSAPVLCDNQVEAQGNPSEHISNTQHILQEGLFNVTEATATYVPLYLKNTLTSSLDVSTDNQATHHVSVPDDPSKHHKVSSDLVENHDKHIERSSSSESINSIPDMAEILQRFGLDWAQSMMRKMEKTEQRSSSDSSASHVN